MLPSGAPHTAVLLGRNVLSSAYTNNGPLSGLTSVPPVCIRMYLTWFRMRCGPPAGSCRAARGIVRRILRGSQAPDLGVDGSINNDTDKRCGPHRELSSMGSRFAWDVRAMSSMLDHVRLLTRICFDDLCTKFVRRSVRLTAAINTCMRRCSTCRCTPAHWLVVGKTKSEGYSPGTISEPCQI